MAKNIDLNVRLKGAKKAEKGLGGVDNKMKSLGKSAMAAAGGFFAARGLINAFKSVVNAAAEQELAEKKLNAVLLSTKHVAGITAVELKNLASELQSMTGIGDETIIRAQSLMLTFTKIGKDVFPQAIETVLNMSVAMGTDMTSSVVQLGKALNDPIAGISALSRVGVQLTDDQKEQIKSFMKANDVASAQKVILAELETQFGGLAKAQGDTMKGSIDKMKSAIGDTAETLGSVFMPQLMVAVEAWKEWAEAGASAINKIKFKLLSDDAKEQLNNIRDNMDETFHNLSDAISNFGVNGETANEVIASLKDNILMMQETIKEIPGFSHELNPMIEKYQEFLGILEKANAQQVVMAASQSKWLAKKQFQEYFKAVKKEGIDADKIIQELGEKFKGQGLNIEDLGPFFMERVQKEREALIKSEQEKALIRSEFAERSFEMTVGNYELQQRELEKAVERFKDAGVEEEEIALFVAQRKKQIDTEYLNTKLSSIGSLSGALGALNEASRGSALVSKRLAQGEALMSTWVAVNKALAAGVPPWNIVQASAIGAMGLANVLKIEQQSFAQGGDFITSGPQAILVGDNPGGRERVQVEPLSSPNISGPKGGITLNISAPLVDDTVIDHIIPAIEKAQRNNLA